MSNQLAFSAMLSLFVMAAFVMSGEMLSYGQGGKQTISLASDITASYGDMIHMPEIPFPSLQ